MSRFSRLSAPARAEGRMRLELCVENLKLFAKAIRREEFGLLEAARAQIGAELRTGIEGADAVRDGGGVVGVDQQAGLARDLGRGALAGGQHRRAERHGL